MVFSPTARRLMRVVLVAVLAVGARSIWSANLRGADEKYVKPAIDKTVGDRVGEEARKRLEDIFMGHRDAWTEEGAINRLVDALRQKTVDLEFERDRLDSVPLPPFDNDPEDARRLSSVFVYDVTSSIRNLSVLDEIGPVTSRTLHQDQLRTYLRATEKVPDYEAVAKSFDPAFTADVVTFTRPTTLLRIYGGDSKAIGRFYFCCLWDAGGFPGMQGAAHWSDASGLATPPENLRQHLAVTTIPAGTTAIVGIVADNFADALGRVEKGGNTQVFIPHVENFPYKEYRRAGDNAAVSEIVLSSDDSTMLRSRP